MSDNIPFDIQMEIIQKVSDVKSLILFRSVSKPWKSYIDSSQFIKGYCARHTQPHSFILRYTVFYGNEVKYVRLVEDDKSETFKVEKQEFAPAVVSPLIKQFFITRFVGASHGLVCLFGPDMNMLVIWNPFIRKSFGVADPNNVVLPWAHIHGFGVRPDTYDPTIVKIIQDFDKPWHVEVFTLSSGVWNVIPTGKLPHQSIQLPALRSGVVIGRFIYWAAFDQTFAYIKRMVVSFDLITMEFKVIDLPDNLTNELLNCSLSQLRESLVVYGLKKVEGARGCDVWVMEHDLSFKKLFSICARVDRKILGFTESGEPIIETPTIIRGDTNVAVYDPCSHQINYLGIEGALKSFDMGSYKESLLLVNQSDLHIYCDRQSIKNMMVTTSLRCGFTK